MTITRIKGKFYPLQEAEWHYICENLTGSEIKVLYYLRITEPFGERFRDICTTDLAKFTKLSIRSVQRALNKLSDLGLIEDLPGKFRRPIRSIRTVETETVDIDINEDFSF